MSIIDWKNDKTLNIKGSLMEINRPLVMGILNVTPDSFFDGGKHHQLGPALKQAFKMLEEGADILDIGGYSSRPGASEVSVEEELDRVVPVIEQIIKKNPKCIISIDTFRSTVADEALKAGASMINDISGGVQDPLIFNVAATNHVPYVMMHMKGKPKTMQSLTDYEDMLSEMMDFFAEQSQKFYKAGGKDLILDPGFGFSKTLDQNYEILKSLDEFRTFFDEPLLVGVSRKSMIYKKLGIESEEALNGTTVLNTIALTKGASILRVHDVKETRETINLLFT